MITAAFQGWSGLKNGTLLDVAERAEFDLLITADQSMTYQQNMSYRKIALIVLSTNNWKQVQSHRAKSIDAIEAIQPGGYLEVAIPTS